MIYLDNAATTFPKPDTVIRETEKCLREYCGNPGRGSHSLSLAASNKIYECRETAAQMFSASDADNVIFTMNTTYALNMAIKSLIKPGDHVLISSMEHNSVFRPIYALKEKGVLSYNVFDAFSKNVVSEIRRHIKPNTSVVVCAHASNVCGRVLPIHEIGRFLRKKGIFFVVDAAQSAGKIDIDIEDMNVDVLCVPGHKGVYGIQGGAMMICGKNFHGDTFVEGGGGINSLDVKMPEFLPERYEGGTLPTPCIAALNEGMKYVSNLGTSYIREKENSLYTELDHRLGNETSVEIYSRSSVFLFNVKGMTSAEVANELNNEKICVRGGFHCSPLAHHALNTGEDGAVRVSFGVFNTKKDVTDFCWALRKIILNHK